MDLRGSYQGRVLGARLDAADAALAERDFPAALAQTEAAVALDRFSERAHRSEMLALYALGRTHEALGRYRTYRVRLDQERARATAELARSKQPSSAKKTFLPSCRARSDRRTRTPMITPSASSGDATSSTAS